MRIARIAGTAAAFAIVTVGAAGVAHADPVAPPPSPTAALEHSVACLPSIGKGIAGGAATGAIGTIEAGGIGAFPGAVGGAIVGAIGGCTP